ncbi:B-cell receptor CD22-like isoform X2 [Nerophis ophidion]|uniref:B-cell receptor CD22-like isoform X2 n=1 Tax=Nerophis ophidion TaxID=159077 RepID=UPI002AE0B127|nr:B-cell receptor CD22-like isoform X2 [Nerophis ophidion]
MLCHTSCLLEAPLSFEWQKNGLYIKSGSKLEVTLSPGDYITCAARQQQHQHISISPPLYVLKRPSVSLSHAGDILEGRPLTLTCDIDNFDNSSATVDYCWSKKKNVFSDDEVLSKGRQLVFKSFKSSDSAEYWCTVENQLGKKTSEPVRIDVQRMSWRTINIIRLFCSAVVVVGILIILTLEFRTTTSPSSTANPNELVQPAEQLDDGDYDDIDAEDAL